jgi:hypothetical protein
VLEMPTRPNLAPWTTRLGWAVFAAIFFMVEA